MLTHTNRSPTTKRTKKSLMKNLREYIRLSSPLSTLTPILSQSKLQPMLSISTRSLKTCLETKYSLLISSLRPRPSGPPSGSNQSNSRVTNLSQYITSLISQLTARSVIIEKFFKKSKSFMIYWKCKNVSYLLVNSIKSKLNELQPKDQ